MIKSLGIILMAILIIISEVPKLRKEKKKNELIVFLMLLVIGVVLSILLAYGKTIPNPLDIITVILKPLSNILSH